MNPPFRNEDRVFFIAEIGGNHEGDLAYAKRLLVKAAQTGADAVKFQIYQGDKIASRHMSPERNKHFKRFELPPEAWQELIALAKKHKVLFMASLWHAEAVEQFDPHLPIHKVGSGDLTNHPLLRLLLSKDKPVIVSTAMATLDEVQELVGFARQCNQRLFERNAFALLHCVAMYGDPQDKYANLLAIRRLQDAFPDIPIGYSDHTKGTYACELAIALGASVIEKHFTDDKKRSFRDHHLSAEPEEFRALIRQAARIKTLLGSYEKAPVSAVETAERIREFRRGVYAARDLPAGTLLTEDDLITLRPLAGIDARAYTSVLGKRLTKAKRAHEPLYEEELKAGDVPLNSATQNPEK